MIQATTTKGLTPDLMVTTDALVAAGGGRPLLATLCQCSGGTVQCLRGYTWPERFQQGQGFIKLGLGSNPTAVRFLASNSPLEFRIRWSATLDAADAPVSDGILSYAGGARPTVSNICR